VSGFDAADYDAFLPKKQGSNAFTLERRRVKEKLQTVARRLGECAPEAVRGLDLETSEDAPSVMNARKVKAVSAYFVRPSATRAGLKALLATDLGAGAHLFEIAVHQQHAHLELRVDLEGIAVGVRIPSGARVDRENVAEKLRLDWAREELGGHLKTLPEAWAGFEDAVEPAGGVSLETMAAWAEAIERSESAWIVEARFPRDDAPLHGPSWAEEGADLMARFAPVLRFLAWSKENDHTRVREVVAKKLDEAEQRAPRIETGTRVTILGGLFSGRAGYVAEVDHKGKAKVMVGPVTITVDADDLKPAG